MSSNPFQNHSLLKSKSHHLNSPEPTGSSSPSQNHSANNPFNRSHLFQDYECFDPKLLPVSSQQMPLLMKIIQSKPLNKKYSHQRPNYGSYSFSDPSSIANVKTFKHINEQRFNEINREREMEIQRQRIAVFGAQALRYRPNIDGRFWTGFQKAQKSEGLQINEKEGKENSPAAKNSNKLKERVSHESFSIYTNQKMFQPSEKGLNAEYFPQKVQRSKRIPKDSIDLPSFKKVSGKHYFPAGQEYFEDQEMVDPKKNEPSSPMFYGRSSEQNQKLNLSRSQNFGLQDQMKNSSSFFEEIKLDGDNSMKKSNSFFFQRPSALKDSAMSMMPYDSYVRGFPKGKNKMKSVSMMSSSSDSYPLSMSLEGKRFTKVRIV